MNTRALLKPLSVFALLAISVTPISAACLNPPLSAEMIGSFRSNPAALVTPSSDARTVEATVRDLAGTDATLAPDLIKVAQGAEPRFRTAIAAGLAQAAIACGTTDQKAALSIQEAVANYDDGQFQASFAAVAGDLSTAATVAAASYAASSAGSVVITNPNPGGPTNLTPNASGGGGAVAALTITASTVSANGASSPATTAAEVVSPTR
jgi:hypothetical protein